MSTGNYTKKFVSTVFRNPYLCQITQPIVVDNEAFWDRYQNSTERTLLVHTGYRNTKQEKALSVAGSLYIDSCEFETPPIWDKNSDEELR